MSLATESNREVADGSKGWSVQAARDQYGAVLQGNSNEEFKDGLTRRAAIA